MNDTVNMTGIKKLSFRKTADGTHEKGGNMYRLVVKFSNGKHRVGTARSMAEASAWFWEMTREARRINVEITNHEMWRIKS